VLGNIWQLASIAPLPTKLLKCLGLKKYLWFQFPTDPIFSADPIIFSTRLTVRPYFLRVVAGCCQKASVVTLIIEKTMKKIFKKNYFRPTDPNFFAI
jgi:hypothetical protein